MPEPAVHGTMKYTNLPARSQMRVFIHPDVKAEWCLYGPDKYKIPVFLRGIYTSVEMGSMTNLVNEKVEPYLSLFYEPNAEAHLGDGFRHEEFGFQLPEPDSEVEAEGESLGPVSGPPINIITETDRTIEKWKIRVGWTLHIFATYFKDYAGFSQFMKMLEGNMTRGINKSLVLILKAVMCADPSEVSFGEKEFARIFGRTKDNTRPDTPLSLDHKTALPARSKSGRIWVDMMRKTIEKYWAKSVRLWPNIRYYNPTYYSHQGQVEEMDKTLLFENVVPGKDKSKRQIQQLYTDAHGTPEDDNNGKTKFNFNTWRVDCLIALVHTLVNTLDRMTTKVTTEMWVGNDTTAEMAQTKEGAKRLRENLSRQGLDGNPVLGERPQDDGYFSNLSTSASYNDGFEVVARPEDIVIFLNPEDYCDLKIGVARRGQMDVREVGLKDLESYSSNIFGMDGIKPGFARVIDKRAFKIMPYFELSDLQEPAEKLAYRKVTHFHMAIRMFNLYAGFLLVPSPHFVASPYYYDKYGLIGQEIEKNK